MRLLVDLCVNLVYGIGGLIVLAWYGFLIVVSILVPVAVVIWAWRIVCGAL